MKEKLKIIEEKLRKNKEIKRGPKFQENWVLNFGAQISRGHSAAHFNLWGI